MGAVTVQVSVPSLLIRCTDGEREVAVEASHLAECVENLLRAFPLLRGHLFDEAGELREHVHLFYNDENLNWLEDWAAVALRPGDTLTIVQAVSGGSCPLEPRPTRPVETLWKTCRMGVNRLRKACEPAVDPRRSRSARLGAKTEGRPCS